MKYYPRTVYSWTWRDIIHLAWYVRPNDWSFKIGFNTYNGGFSFGPIWVCIMWRRSF